MNRNPAAVSFVASIRVQCMRRGGPPVDGSLQFSSSAVRGSPISVDNDGHVVALSEVCALYFSSDSEFLQMNS